MSNICVCGMQAWTGAGHCAGCYREPKDKPKHERPKSMEITVGDLIEELSDLDPDTPVEVTIPMPDLDAEQVLTDFTLILQNGRFTIHATS